MSLCNFPALPIGISLLDIVPPLGLPGIPAIPTLAALTLPCLADLF